MGASDLHLSDGAEDPKQHTPWVSLVLAYAAMVPIVAGTLACLMLHAPASAIVCHLTVMWAGAVLCFLAGVRRGLSFRQAGGPTMAQLATMLWLFVLGAGSLLSPWVIASLALQLLGYATMAVFDPVAARRHEAPRYFQRLRPAQMLVPLVSLAILMATQLF